jgi:paraquat-inducible protein A
MQQVPDLIACKECDAVHRRLALGHNEVARCSRCGAELERDMRAHVKRVLPLTLASVFMYIIANVFPIAEIEFHGVVNSTTLMGAVLSLNAEEMPLLAFLVFATTILFPLLQLLALIYLLISINGTARPHGLNLLVRMIQTFQPWVMVEVLLLGAIVAFVKLTSMVAVTPGPALWALGSLALLFASVLSFNPRYIWHISLPERRRETAAAAERARAGQVGQAAEKPPAMKAESP